MEPASLPRIAYSIKEVAQMLGVCQRTVRRLIARGLLKPSKALRHIRISANELERFLKETREFPIYRKPEAVARAQ